MESVSAAHASADEGSQMQAAVDMLATRVDTFEHDLHEAMAAEQSFRRNLQTVTRALDAFIETHRQEDMHLTRMVQEDTQRSRDAKEEYDVLVARFEDSVRPNRSTRRRELVKTISLYISIVLSVVFMAPLHAIVSLFEKLLNRMGYRRQDDGYGVDSGYADATSRYRARQNWRRAATAARFSSSLRQRYETSHANQRNEERSSSSYQQPSTKESVLSQPLDSDTAAGAKLTEMYLAMPGTSPEEDMMWMTHGLATTAAQLKAENELRSSKNDDQSDGAPPKQTSRETRSDVSSDSEDIFVDAKAGPDIKADARESASDADKIAGVDENRSSEQRDGASSRPEWARPSDTDTDQTPPEMSIFPSSDFWNISDDELRIDVLRRESSLSSPTD